MIPFSKSKRKIPAKGDLMSELQTFVAVVVLIYVLCVIVQAVQEFIKSVLNTKAATMEQTVTEFMGDHLNLDQVKGALQQRGLNITALDHFNKDDFRKLLDGVEFTAAQIANIPQVVAVAAPTLDQFKDSIAASYEAARGKFQRLYTTKNKQIAIVISFAVVLILNASVIRIYEVLAANQSLSQAIAGTALTVNQSQQNAVAAQTQDLAAAYEKSRTAISVELQKYPILLRTGEYPKDFGSGLPSGNAILCATLWELLGLLLMGALVSLGAPFWNDVLKGISGLNNQLNSSGK
jgi:hypothetical protein